ncbi:hypothetical protein QOT17_001424 [Balamuthia mandrillaris]
MPVRVEFQRIAEEQEEEKQEERASRTTTTDINATSANGQLDVENVEQQEEEGGHRIRLPIRLRAFPVRRHALRGLADRLRGRTTPTFAYQSEMPPQISTRVSKREWIATLRSIEALHHAVIWRKQEFILLLALCFGLVLFAVISVPFLLGGVRLEFVPLALVPLLLCGVAFWLFHVFRKEKREQLINDFIEGENRLKWIPRGMQWGRGPGRGLYLLVSKVDPCSWNYYNASAVKEEEVVVVAARSTPQKSVTTLDNSRRWQNDGLFL